MDFAVDSRRSNSAHGRPRTTLPRHAISGVDRSPTARRGDRGRAVAAGAGQPACACGVARGGGRRALDARRPRAWSRASWRRAARRRAPGWSPAICSSRSASTAIDTPSDVLDVLHRPAQRRGADLHRAAAGAARARAAAVARRPRRAPRALLRPGGGRDLHAVRRLHGAAAADARSGLAALLLAVGRLLRRLRVLLQRPVRSARLGLLLGRRGGARPAAAAVPPLRARLSRAPQRLGANADGTRRAAARLPAGVPARRPARGAPVAADARWRGVHLGCSRPSIASSWRISRPACSAASR